MTRCPPDTPTSTLAGPGEPGLARRRIIKFSAHEGSGATTVPAADCHESKCKWVLLMPGQAPGLPPLGPPRPWAGSPPSESPVPALAERRTAARRLPTVTGVLIFRPVSLYGILLRSCLAKCTRGAVGTLVPYQCTARAGTGLKLFEFDQKPSRLDSVTPLSFYRPKLAPHRNEMFRSALLLACVACASAFAPSAILPRAGARG
jgi:hypothetical protein